VLIRIGILIVCLLPFRLSAQLSWKPVSTAVTGELPLSLQVFETNDTLNRRTIHAYYVEADLRDRRLVYTAFADSGQSMSINKTAPYIAITASVFNQYNHRNNSLLINRSKIESPGILALKSRYSDSVYYVTRGAFGLTKKYQPDIAWVFADTAKRWPAAFHNRPLISRGVVNNPKFKNLNTMDYWKKWKMKMAIGGGPVLVHESIIHITCVEEQFLCSDELRPRTAIGYTKDHRIIILVVQGNMFPNSAGVTLEEEARIMVDLGCEAALNLNTDAATSLRINGREIIKGDSAQRAVFAIEQHAR
jgi:hypothetical protein